MRKCLRFGMILVFSCVAQGAQTGKVGQDVLEAIEAEGEANVVVALAKPPSWISPHLLARRSAVPRDTPDLSRLRKEMTNLRTRVLSELYASEFRERHVYHSLPALAGRVNEAGLAKLVADPDVVRIDLDFGGTGTLASSVPLIGADQQHPLGFTGTGVVVAMLDSGLDTDHADLAGDLIQEECFLDNDSLPGPLPDGGAGLCPDGSDRQSGPGAAESGIDHGVMTAGIITSAGTISAIGVAPDAQIVAIKVLDNTPPAGEFKFFSNVLAALDFIINNPGLGIDIINMSFGTVGTFVGSCDSANANTIAAADAINTLRASGVIAFASSGNGGSGTEMTSPACIANVVSVGATDNADNVATSTNSNATLDIMAPGVSITSTGLANGTATLSGTSFASPHAAGCAALLIESGVAVTPDQIETHLESSSIMVTDPKNGLSFPRLDCSPVNDNTVLIAHFMNGNSELFSSRVYLWNPSTTAGGVTVRVFTLPLREGTSQELTDTPLTLGTLGARSALNLKLAEDILAPLGIPLPYTDNAGNLTLVFTIGAPNVRGSAQVFTSTLAFGTYPLQEIPSTSGGNPTVLVANFMNGNTQFLNSRVYLWNPSSIAGNVTVRLFSLPNTGDSVQLGEVDLGFLPPESARNIRLAEDILAPLGIPLPYMDDGGNLILEFTIDVPNAQGVAQVFSSSLAFGTYPLQ